jgi:hypothetical protein
MHFVGIYRSPRCACEENVRTSGGVDGSGSTDVSLLAPLLPVVLLEGHSGERCDSQPETPPWMQREQGMMDGTMVRSIPAGGQSEAGDGEGGMHFAGRQDHQREQQDTAEVENGRDTGPRKTYKTAPSTDGHQPGPRAVGQDINPPIPSSKQGTGATPGPAGEGAGRGRRRGAHTPPGSGELPRYEQQGLP